MKITKQELQNAKNGSLGFFYSESHLVGIKNNIENVIKVNDDKYKVQCEHDRGPTIHSLSEMVANYGGKYLNS